MLLDAPTRIKDFFSPDATHSDYLCESAEIVKKASGATKVVPSIGCVVRRSERSANFREGKTTVLGRFVHCDFSPNPEGSRLWVRKVLPSEEAEKQLMACAFSTAAGYAACVVRCAERGAAGRNPRRLRGGHAG